MKRKFLLLSSLILVFLLTGCKSVNVLKCESDDGSIIKIVYNNEEVLEGYDNGIELTIDEINQLNVNVEEWYSSVTEYIEDGIDYLTASGDTCKVSNKINWFVK